jgi:hypothetical protein
VPLETDRPSLDREDGRTVRCGDVNAEVERPVAPITDARIAEEAADGVLLDERLHWPNPYSARQRSHQTPIIGSAQSTPNIRSHAAAS